MPQIEATMQHTEWVLGSILLAKVDWYLDMDKKSMVFCDM